MFSQFYGTLNATVYDSAQNVLKANDISFQETCQVYALQLYFLFTEYLLLVIEKSGC